MKKSNKVYSSIDGIEEIGRKILFIYVYQFMPHLVSSWFIIYLSILALNKLFRVFDGTVHQEHFTGTEDDRHFDQLKALIGKARNRSDDNLTTFFSETHDKKIGKNDHLHYFLIRK